ncbi:hypothetical protein TUM4433_15080 [Shewanella schlegeliana]|nr:hypothetical protein TUM4433_15080 [Shewanella schlegeliana]
MDLHRALITPRAQDNSVTILGIGQCQLKLLGIRYQEILGVAIEATAKNEREYKPTQDGQMLAQLWGV